MLKTINYSYSQEIIKNQRWLRTVSLGKSQEIQPSLSFIFQPRPDLLKSNLSSLKIYSPRQSIKDTGLKWSIKMKAAELSGQTRRSKWTTMTESEKESETLQYLPLG